MYRADPVPMGVGVMLRCVVVLACVLLFFTGLDNYAFAFWSAPKPLYWVIFFVGAAAALAIVNPHRPLPLLRSPFFAWVYFFSLVTTVWAVWARNSPAIVQLLDERYRSIALLVAYAVLFDEPRARRVGVLAVAVAVGFASIANVAEFLGFISFSEFDPSVVERVGGRAAGFYVNANGSGMIIVLGLSLAIPVIPKAWRVPLLLVGCLGVLATFSRGALVGLGVMIFWLIWRKAIGFWPVLVGVLCAIALTTYATRYMGSHGLLDPEMLARLRFEKDDSGRIALALRAWRMFLDAPLLGQGIGATVDWNERALPHNMYVSLAADHGILGLLVVPALGVALVASNRGAELCSLLLMVAAFFTHNLFDDRAVLLAIALAATGVALRPAANQGHSSETLNSSLA